jgi:hypothetical protein
MSSSTKSDISHDTREFEPKQRRSLRSNRNIQLLILEILSSIEAKMPKIVKSSSSIEKAKLETLYCPNKGSPKVIKSHEDSENSKSKSSSKMSFWFHQTYSHELKSYLVQ